FEMTVEAAAVGGAEIGAKAGGIGGESVEGAGFGAAAVGGGEEILESGARVRRHRQRSGGGGPTDGFGVHATVVESAGAAQADVFDGELDGGRRGVVAKG